jgi:hypothetical protein
MESVETGSIPPDDVSARRQLTAKLEEQAPLFMFTPVPKRGQTGRDEGNEHGD